MSYKTFEIRDILTDELIYIGYLENDKNIRTVCENKHLLSEYIKGFPKDRFSFIVIDTVDNEEEARKETSELIEYYGPRFYDTIHTFDIYAYYKDME